MPASVEKCEPRRDGKYLITFGRGRGFAIADEPIPVGKDAIVRDGKAVPA